MSLTPTAIGSSVFVGFSGDCTGTTCSLSMATDHAVTATFGPAANLFFVTANAIPLSSITSLSAADQACSTAAAAAKLPGTFKAFLSSSTVNASARFGTARGWVMPDGSQFIDTIGDALNDSFRYSAEVNETGARTMYAQVATGTLFNGSPDQNCKDFTSTAASDNMSIGSNEGAGAQWVNVGTGPCNGAFHLYCFGVDKTFPLPALPVVGRRAFITAASWVPGGGLSSADAVCANEATIAALPGTYRADLQTSTAGGLARFDLTGPNWARTDGVLLASSITNLGNGTWFSRPLTRADGTYVPRGQSFWGTGTNSTLDTTVNCNDWTSSSAADAALTTLVDYANGGMPKCNTSSHLLCLQN